MKLVGLVVVIILIISAVVLAVLSQYGLFAPVQVVEEESGKYLLIYQKHLGDYKHVGQVMDEIYYDIKNNHHLETTKGFGLYYDNPQEVEKAQLRSIVGCIIEGQSIGELDKISEKYKIGEYPSSKSVVVEFPYKGMLSIIIGTFKVYPKLAAYIKKHNYNKTPIMELYDQPNEKMKYISSIHLPDEIFTNLLD